MNIIQNLVQPNDYELKCPYKMTPEFIVVHNTANDASARNEIAYMKQNRLSTSFHFAVDDKEIIQGIPLDRNAWHAGDGGSGVGNRKGIGIEICYSKSGGQRFVDAEKKAVELIRHLLDKYGWGVDKVKKHQDFSGKYCPHRTLDMGWTRFVDMIGDKDNNSDISVYQHMLGSTIILRKGLITAVGACELNKIEGNKFTVEYTQPGTTKKATKELPLYDNNGFLNFSLVDRSENKVSNIAEDLEKINKKIDIITKELGYTTEELNKLLK